MKEELQDTVVKQCRGISSLIFVQARRFLETSNEMDPRGHAFILFT